MNRPGTKALPVPIESSSSQSATVRQKQSQKKTERNRQRGCPHRGHCNRELASFVQHVAGVPGPKGTRTDLGLFAAPSSASDLCPVLWSHNAAKMHSGTHRPKLRTPLFSWRCTEGDRLRQNDDWSYIARPSRAADLKGSKPGQRSDRPRSHPTDDDDPTGRRVTRAVRELSSRVQFLSNSSCASATAPEAEEETTREPSPAIAISSSGWRHAPYRHQAHLPHRSLRRPSGGKLRLVCIGLHRSLDVLRQAGSKRPLNIAKLCSTFGSERRIVEARAFPGSAVVKKYPPQ